MTISAQLIVISHINSPNYFTGHLEARSSRWDRTTAITIIFDNKQRTAGSVGTGDLRRCLVVNTHHNVISATFQLITYRCCEKTGDQTIVIPSRKINQIQEGLTRKLYYAQKTRPSLSFELFLWKCKALFLYGLCFQPRPRQKYFLHIQPNAFVIKHTQIF